MNETINIGGISVMIGTPVDNPIPHLSAASYMKTMYQAGLRNMNLSFAIEVSGLVQIGRDKVLDNFLKSDCRKLFWIDSDMVWEPEDFSRMVALSTMYDVVTASYPLKVEGGKTFIVKYDENNGVEPNKHGLFRIEGVGLGFTIMDRKVAEKIIEGRPRYKDALSGREVAKVFDVTITDDGDLITEDMLFFEDVRKLGFDVWCDPSIELGHMGERQWRGKLANAMEKINNGN